MSVYKLDLIFEAGGRGWRESYYRNFEQTAMGSVLGAAQTLAALRSTLSGKGVLIKAYSITDPLAAGRQGESVPFATPFDGFHLTAGSGATDPSSAVNILWADDVTRLHRRQWYRGVWDLAISHFGKLNSPDFLTWRGEFFKLREYLLEKQYGWINRPRADEQACAYSYLEDSLVPKFTFAADFFPVEAFNKFQSVRFSKFNGSKSTLNRELVVKVIDARNCEAALPIAAGPMVSAGKCIRYGPGAFVIASNIGVGRVGRRSPGSPLLHTPGRAKASPRI